jgi:hypothetical protein
MNLSGLWADGWFYISALGFLVSGALFFALLGQYRAAVEAADQNEPDLPVEAATSPLNVDFTPEPKRSFAPLASVAPAPSPSDKPDFQPSANSPALDYMKNIKTQLIELHAEVRQLTARIDAIGGRDEALIERLTEMTVVVASLKNSGASSPSASEPARKPKKVEVPAPSAETTQSVPVQAPPEKKPELKLDVKPALSPDETMRMELDAVIASQLPRNEVKSAAAPETAPKLEPAPEPAPSIVSEPEPGEKPRRGPVWPV